MGEELKYISKNTEPREQGQFKELRDMYMKMYTFLVGLTRRMSADYRENLRNDELHRVLEQSVRSMTEILESPDDVIDITNNTIFRRDINHNEIAGFINKKIDKSMRNFFEV